MDDDLKRKALKAPLPWRERGWGEGDVGVATDMGLRRFKRPLSPGPSPARGEGSACRELTRTHNDQT